MEEAHNRPPEQAREVLCPERGSEDSRREREEVPAGEEEQDEEELYKI